MTFRGIISLSHNTMIPYLFPKFKHVDRKTLCINPIDTAVFLKRKSLASLARSNTSPILLCRIAIAGKERDDGRCDATLQSSAFAK